MALKDTATLPTLSQAPEIERLYPPVAEGSRLLAACLPSDYSASRIAHAVEDCDAQLLNLNVTSDSALTDNRTVFELRVNHRSPAAVARSLERYGFEVLDVDRQALADDAVMASRLAELIHYLEL